MFKKRIINVFQVLVIVGLMNCSHTAFGDDDLCTFCNATSGACCDTAGPCGMCTNNCGGYPMEGIGCTSGCGFFTICCVLPDESEIITTPVCCAGLGGTVGCDTAAPNEEEPISSEATDGSYEEYLSQPEEETTEESKPTLLDSWFIKFLAMYTRNISNG